MAKKKARPEGKSKKASKPAAKPKGSSSSRGEYGLLAVVAWVLLILACGLALLPSLGFISWLIATPLVAVALVLSVIIMFRGGRIHGGLLLALSVIGAPFLIFFGHDLSAAPGVAALMSTFSKSEESKPASKAKQAASNSKAGERPRTTAASSTPKRQSTKPQENRSEDNRPKINVLLEKNAPD